MTGQVVANYRVLEKRGGGGMGVVERALDLRLKREVALKCLSPELSSNPSAQERFRREAEAISGLNHPHICTLHDVFEHDGRTFIVFELLDGHTLGHPLARGRPLSVASSCCNRR